MHRNIKVHSDGKINSMKLIYFFMNSAILLPSSYRKDITMKHIALVAAMLTVLAPSTMASATTFASSPTESHGFTAETVRCAIA